MTDNELIAEFMGVTDTMFYNYDTSWDWLMPVVEKINDLYDKNFPVDFVTKLLAKEPNGTEPYLDVIGLPVSTPINEVYGAVVEFIKWYNENKQQ